MYERMLLGIARLFDSAEMRGSKNVSFQALLVATAFETSNERKHEALASAILTARRVSGACIKHRHKRISHLDQRTRSGLRKLPSTTLKLIDDSLGACEETVEKFYVALSRGSISFDVGQPEAAERLIERLSNRRSQRLKGARSRIVFTRGDRQAILHRVYCGSQVPIDYYPTRRGLPSLLARSHFDEGDGVIGCEKVHMNVVETTGAETAEVNAGELLERALREAARPDH